MPKTIFADRGLSMALETTMAGAAENPTWVAASRLGRLCIAVPAHTVWLQMRGCSRIVSSDGSFLLQRGEWIAFARDSRPELQSDRGGLTLGLVLPAIGEDPMPAYRYSFPLVGRGTLPRHERNLAMRIWRHAAQRAPSETLAATRPFLLNLTHSQQELMMQFSRCPGRSFRRKSEAFEVLQRVKLYLDGNSHRLVRNVELAAVSGYSAWYLSKIFNCVYEASPQSIACQYRLERARHLLAHTFLGITEVSAACGFSNPAIFARAFRSGYGTTASKYRKSAHRMDRTTLLTTFDVQAGAHP
jgi:AraC family transcriptional regulator